MEARRGSGGVGFVGGGMSGGGGGGMRWDGIDG